MEKYFVIQSNNEGGVYIKEYSEEEELLKDVMDDMECNVTYNAKIPNYSSMTWSNEAIIIKGRIVTPQPKEVVTKYEIY
jgi:hypothetical protein